MDLQAALETYCQQSVTLGGGRVRRFAHISDGWENEVYSFTLQRETDSGPASEDLILRVYPGDDAITKAKREFAVMDRLFHLGYPVPEVRIVETTGSALGRPFVIMRRIDGEPLGPVLRRPPFARKRQLIELFCKTLVQLHSLDWHLFVSDTAAYCPEGFVDRWLARARTLVDSLAPGQFDPAFDWLAAHTPKIGEARLAVVHWDYHARNVLLARDGKAFVIDWTSAEVTDFRFDLGWTLLLEGMYDGWPMHESILHEYERLSGAPIEHIEFFEVIACVRRLFSILVSLSRGPQRLGMRPEAETTMRAQLGHVEGVYSILTYRTGVTLPAVEALIS